MRDLDLSLVTNEIARLCVEANRALPEDLASCIARAGERESCPLAKGILGDLCDNMRAAGELAIPVCQDTGMAVVFAEIGQDIHFTGGLFEDAVNEGVRRGYVDGLLRCSVVADPIRRGNTGDNTPAVLHTRLVAGDKLRLTVAPKGFGSENMSRMRMFTPAASPRGPHRLYCRHRPRGRGNPCPPVVLGSGSAEILSCAPCWLNRRCAAPFPSATPIPFTRRWSERSWSRSIVWAWDRRVSEGIPPLWRSISRPIPPTSPGCRLRSMWAAM